MKIDRLIGIISILLQNEKVTAPFLAEKFEVSRRTINRDIESICQSGIPLVTEQGQNGGISIMNGYAIDRTALTSSEMNAILTGLQSLDSVSGTKQYQQLMEKLCIGTSKGIPQKGETTIIPGTGIYINLSSYYKTALSPKIELFKEAIKDHYEVEFTYFSPNKTTKRTIQPYILIFSWSSWYVWGYCNLRKEFRLFKLNRMKDIILTDLPFLSQSQIPSPESSLQAAFPQTLNVKVVFSKNVKWRIIDEFGEDCITKEEADKITIDFTVSDKTSLFTLLLSYGPDAELLEPKELRIEFLDYIHSIQKKY